MSPKTVRIKIKRYRCYGTESCANYAPKEGMCESCSRRKYGTWLQMNTLTVEGRLVKKQRVDF